MEALPTAKRRAAGMGLHNAADTLGKRRRTQHFEDDGDDESDDEKETTNRKHNQPDLGNIGYAAAEKKVMSDALENSVDGVKRYGDKSGKWEEKDEKLMPFNLKTEMEDGYFDEEGVYVEHKAEAVDPRDAWLDDFAERNNGKFAKADAEEEQEEERAMTVAERIERQKEIVALLQPGEDVARAIKRLRAEKATMEKLTDLASDLLNSGMYNIYSETREEIQKAVDATMQKAARAEAAKSASEQPEMWEYKTTMEEGAEVHGPFSAAHMQAWMDGGYFKEKPVWARRIAPPAGAAAAAAAAAPAPSDEKLAVGMTVTIVGLSGAAEHNGKQATIQKHYPKTGRFVVQVKGGDMMAVKPENLTTQDPAAAAAPPREPFRSSNEIDCFSMF